MFPAPRHHNRLSSGRYNAGPVFAIKTCVSPQECPVILLRTCVMNMLIYKFNLIDKI